METAPPPLPEKKKTSPWLFIAPAVGFIVLIIIVAGGAFAFQSMKKKRAASQAALAEIQNTATEEREKLADSIEKGEISGSDDAIGRMKQQLEKSANQMAPDDAAAARALAGYLAQMQKQAQAYEAALKGLIDAEVLSFDLRDRAAIAGHRKLLVDFAAANDQLTDLVRRSEKLARTALTDAKVPERTIEATMTGFNKGRPQRQLQLRIREQDRILGEAGLAALDLLEKNWGRWSRDETSGELTFQDDAALAAFNEQMAKIQAAADEQGKAQQELAGQMHAMKRP